MKVNSLELATWTLAIAVAVLIGWPMPLVGGGDEASRSVQDGVYSKAQASRGRKEFQQLCRTCHERNDFRGAYMQAWDGQTAYELYYLLLSTMPEEAPGMGGPEVFTDIVAYLFSLSEFPAGESEMASGEESMKGIRIEGPYGGGLQ